MAKNTDRSRLHACLHRDAGVGGNPLFLLAKGGREASASMCHATPHGPPANAHQKRPAET